MPRPRVTLRSEPLLTEFDSNTGRFIVKRKLLFEVNGRLFEVDEGFDSDGSTIPAMARFFISKQDVLIAGIVHDDLYRYATYPDGEPISRMEADIVWREVAQYGYPHSGTSPQRAKAAYWIGLRLGAFIPWRNHRSRGLRR